MRINLNVLAIRSRTNTVSHNKNLFILKAINDGSHPIRNFFVVRVTFQVVFLVTVLLRRSWSLQTLARQFTV